MSALKRPKRQDISASTIKQAAEFFREYEQSDRPANQRIRRIANTLGLNSKDAWRWVYVVRPFFRKQDEPWPHYEYPKEAAKRLNEQYGYSENSKEEKPAPEQSASQKSVSSTQQPADAKEASGRVQPEEGKGVEDPFDIDSNYQYNPLQDQYLLKIPSFEHFYVFPGSQAREFVELYSDYDGDAWTLDQCARHFGLPIHVMEEIKRCLRLRHKSPPRLREEFRDGDVDQFVQDDTAKLMHSYEKKLQAEKDRVVRRKAKKWDKQASILDERLRRQAKHLAESVDEYEPAPVSIHVSDDRPTGALVCNWQDLHVGKRRYRTDESLDQYCEDLLSGADKLFTRAAQFAELERVFIVVGGDLSHIDTYNETTTRGTAQDTVASFVEIEAACEDFMVDAVDRARSVLRLTNVTDVDPKVELVPVFGNHDRHTSFSIYRYLYAWFKDCSDVVSPLDADERVCRRYKDWFLGFTHGDLSKKQLRRMPQIMMREDGSRQLHAMAQYMALYHGHLHEEIIKMVAGVKHHQAPSPAPTDRYENRNAYSLNPAVLPGHLILDEVPDDYYFNASILKQ